METLSIVPAPFGRWLKRSLRRNRAESRSGLEWSALPRAAQIYLRVVILAGAAAFALSVPVSFERPGLFIALLLGACLTSLWKINLPIPLTNGSTLSVSYAADLAALLLLGPQQATLIAVAGVWTQCTINTKRPYPLYRTLFSAAGEAITMAATGIVYEQLGGVHAPIDAQGLAIPLAGAISTYFLLNTGLVAGAIGAAGRRPVITVWREEFAWSFVSFLVAGGAGALMAMLIQRGDEWKGALLIPPVYLTYRTYAVFVGRLNEESKRNDETTRQLNGEKWRLMAQLAEMTRLEQLVEQRLRREQTAREGAEEASQRKDQFLAVVSHELRTPLNAVLGWAHMLRHDSLDEGKRQRALSAIFQGAERQAQLIEDLLDFARMTSGTLRFEYGWIDWSEVVGAALDIVQPAADSRQVAITVQVDPFVGVFYGDRTRLQQVVWNLMANAVKFTPIGGAVCVSVTTIGGVVELTVADTGQGIPPAFLPSVFEPFRQADGSVTKRDGGLGLGLSIVRHLVEAHGGTIDVLSAGVGLGSTFTVRLPLQAARARATASLLRSETTVTVRPPDHVLPLRGTSALVVEGDSTSCDLMATSLADHGAAVYMAASAAEALGVLRQQRVDVLLVDIGLPHQEGYELIRSVRGLPSRRNARIPAAAVSAFPREDDRRRAFEAGFQAHLSRPVDPDTLIATVMAIRKVVVAPTR